MLLFPTPLPAWFLSLAQLCGGGCTPQWVSTFGPEPGTDGSVKALAVFDSGSGDELYLGGDFSLAGSALASGIARWNGATWEPLGVGVRWPLIPNETAEVLALCVFDDGLGEDLYVGGYFGNAGATFSPTQYIARWDGSAWSDLGGTNGTVHALVVFDDGSGPALYAGGSFTEAGGQPASRIARWDGAAWSPLGAGTNGTVHALAVHDSGGGPELYAGGSFTQADGAPANRVARWDGASWSALGSGANDVVLSLASFDPGGGALLHAGGNFTSAGGAAQTRRIARWNGSSWSSLGSGANGSVASLLVFDDGSGAALYAGGSLTGAGGTSVGHVARWNGSSWSALDSGTDASVLAQVVFDAGSGPRLFAGGFFWRAGGLPARGIASWDGATWSPLSLGLTGGVKRLASVEEGDGTSALFAAGEFTDAGGVAVSRIARWDGAGWSPLGSGLLPNQSAFALAGHDDGSGAALYAGGSFTSVGGVGANRVARWDGAWSALGSGTDGSVFALASHDDGTGPALYAGGLFTAAGGGPASLIARWDGVAWSALGTGLGGGVVNALVVFDDGTGAALIAGGSFTSAGGLPAGRLARWDGIGWSPLGAGVDGGLFPSISALAVFDDGTGVALYAGGAFTTAGGVPASGVARWDGSAWSSLGAGVEGHPNPLVTGLAGFDDGCSPVLCVGGTFTHAGGLPAANLATWDGAAWTPLGAGTNGPVRTLAVHDGTPGRPALFVGGDFAGAPDSGDSYLARWQGCDDTLAPVLACPARIDAYDLAPSGGEVIDFVVTASDLVDPSPTVQCVPPSGSLFPLGVTLVTCTATDASGNQATCQFEVSVTRKTRRR